VRTASVATHVPDTFIVKAARSAAPAVANELRNDWAALQLLTDLSGDDVPLAPRLYGGDRHVPLVVMEDLGSGEGSPHQAVEGDDADAATASSLAYIRAVARLHLRA
jgi:hypothetical protein